MKCILRKIFMSLAATLPQATVSQTLAVGDMAPDFELMGSDGVVYKLSDFKGKKAIVIAWFPKAFTGG
jgi:peroxiredoxin Q/BCP